MISNQVDKCIEDATQEEDLVTRLDTARETAGRSLETLAPYAANAKESAAHYAEEARQRLGPALESLGPRFEAATGQARTGTLQAAHSARVGYAKHVAPHVVQAFLALPPKTQESTLKAVHRAQEAALAAKHSADRATTHARVSTLPKISGALEDARAAAVPVVQEAQLRGAAAFTALQGHVSADEIGAIAAKNAKKANRNGLATGLAIAGTVAVGSGVLIWQWWRRQSEPEWLVEPPEVQGPPNTVHPASRSTGATPSGASPASPTSATSPASPASPASPVSPLNGSGPADLLPGTGTAADHGQDGKPAPGDPDDHPHPKPHDPRKPH